MTIILPHYENYIPLVSSRPFDPFDSNFFLTLLTRPSDRDQHSCSNLVQNSNAGMTSFIAPLGSQDQPPRSSKLQLYQHLNSTQCAWEFHVWLPLSVLTNATQCNAQLSRDGTIWTLSLPLYYAYVHINVDGGISVIPHASQKDIVSATWSIGQEFSVPFLTYPCNVDNDSHANVGNPAGSHANMANAAGGIYIYPIMTDASIDFLEVIFYSISNSGSPITQVEGTTDSGAKCFSQLLYSSSSSSMVRQAWSLIVPGISETAVFLHLWPCSDSSSCTPFNFSWPISTRPHSQPRIAAQMNGEIGLLAADQNSKDKKMAFFWFHFLFHF